MIVAFNPIPTNGSKDIITWSEELVDELNDDLDMLSSKANKITTDLNLLRVVSGVSSGGNTNLKTYPKEFWLVILSRHDNGSTSIWIVFNSNNSIGRVQEVALGSGATLTYHTNGVITLNRAGAYSYSMLRIN